MAENNHIRPVIILPFRGRIYDRNNLVIADNILKYSILFDKNYFNKQSKDIILHLLRIINKPPELAQEIYDNVKQDRAVDGVTVFDNLSWDDVSKISLNMYKLPGMFIEASFKRYYPFGSLFSQGIGYVGKVSESDLSDSSIIKNPNIRIGKSGIEKTFNRELSGKLGLKKVEVDAKGFSIQDIAFEASVPGEDLVLSLDSGLQKLAFDKFVDFSGASTLVDIKTGEVLSMVSTPDFDPNSFVDGVSSKYWKELNDNPDFPMMNKNLAMAFPPGSPFKLVVCLAALEGGIDPEMHIDCPGYYQLGDRKFHCWKRSGHGRLNMHQAINQSCNVYMFTVGRRIGIDLISEMARKIGLGEKTNIPLTGEVKGLVPDQLWKKNSLKQNWQVADTLNSSIGQGYNLVTLVQLALMSARIASGKMVMLDVIKNIQLKEFANLAISDKSLKFIRKVMVDVVNSERGTARKFGKQDFIFAGKTGTIQVISKRSENDDLSLISVPKKFRNHGVFMGFGPAINPRFAVATVCEHSGYPAPAIDLSKELLINANKYYG